MIPSALSILLLFSSELFYETKGRKGCFCLAFVSEGDPKGEEGAIARAQSRQSHSLNKGGSPGLGWVYIKGEVIGFIERSDTGFRRERAIKVSLGS